MKRIFCLILVFVSLFAFASCSSKKKKEETLKIEEEISQEISAEKGGKIENSDKSISIEVPGEALESDTKITMKIYDAGKYIGTEGKDFISKVVEFEPSGIIFKKPVIITMTSLKDVENKIISAAVYRDEKGEWSYSKRGAYVILTGRDEGGDPIMKSAGGDPIMLNAGGDPIMIPEDGGDPIMLSAGGDPIMVKAGGDPIMQDEGGDPIMQDEGGDPIMQDEGGDPIMHDDGGDPIMNAAGGDPIMKAAGGDPIMMTTGHFTAYGFIALEPTGEEAVENPDKDDEISDSDEDIIPDSDPVEEPEKDDEITDEDVDAYSDSDSENDTDAYSDSDSENDSDTYSEINSDVDSNIVSDADVDNNFDADGDGLPDNQEVFCENLGVHSSTSKDTDGDGYSDLAEIMIGSDPCNVASGVEGAGVKYYFELPYEGEMQNLSLVFSPHVQKADIFFNVDTTGSMGGEINTLKSSLSSTIIPEIRAKITDSAFGVSFFDDFPVNGYGTPGTDLPFGLLQSPTTDIALAQAGVDGLELHSGSDTPESGYESLYKIATGAELSWNGGSVATGGVGFRSGTIPIVFHITDAAAHDSSNNPYNSSYVYTVFNQSQVISAMNTIGAKVVSVVSAGGVQTGMVKSQLSAVSNGTGAVVPSCANAEVTTLLYSIESDGSGLDSSVVNGVDALIKYTSFGVRVEVVGDLEDPSIDTSCFMKKITALEYLPINDCAATISVSPAAFNGADYNNGFSNFSMGTSTSETQGNRLRFKVEALNDCFQQKQEAKMFKVYVNLIEHVTGSVLDTQSITVIVPAKAAE